jgi:2-polyprenyl-3-methyl-5-hydroxy-6-metoxy-1,4-benzoquinol methylase
VDDTEGPEYAERLRRKQGVWWKRVLPVQAPHRFNLRRRRLGRTLDVGCGLGRNLAVLDAGSVGVDHNVEAVRQARADGYEAYTVEEFASQQFAEGSFTGLLVAHVIEHMPREQAVALLRDYLPYVAPGGRVFLICPQERGYASDPTHVQFTTGEDLVAIAREAGLEPGTPYSFPLPRWAGKAFLYNEFCLSAVRV